MDILQQSRGILRKQRQFFIFKKPEMEDRPYVQFLKCRFEKKIVKQR